MGGGGGRKQLTVLCIRMEINIYIYIYYFMYDRPICLYKIIYTHKSEITSIVVNKIYVSLSACLWKAKSLDRYEFQNK